MIEGLSSIAAGYVAILPSKGAADAGATADIETPAPPVSSATTESRPAEVATDASQDDYEQTGNGERAREPLSSTQDVRGFLIGRSVQGGSGPATGMVAESGLETADAPVNEGGAGGAMVAQEALSPEEKEQVEKLQQRDREVRMHEQAHVSAGGSYVRGGINYTYQMGPDDRQYAIGGNVSLDTSAESTPEATIAKARQLVRAALAPADPSPQDFRVAAEALRMEMEARREMVSEGSPDPLAPEEAQDSDAGAVQAMRSGSSAE